MRYLISIVKQDQPIIIKIQAKPGAIAVSKCTRTQRMLSPQHHPIIVIISALFMAKVMGLSTTFSTILNFEVNVRMRIWVFQINIRLNQLIIIEDTIRKNPLATICPDLHRLIYSLTSNSEEQQKKFEIALLPTIILHLHRNRTHTQSRHQACINSSNILYSTI